MENRRKNLPRHGGLSRTQTLAQLGQINSVHFQDLFSFQMPNATVRHVILFH